MNIRNNASRKLVRTLAILLAVSFVLSLAGSPASTGAIGPAANAAQEPPKVIARTQGSTGEDVPLAGQEGWAQAAVVIDGAPADAVVHSVRVKYHVAQTKAEDLQVQLRTSGAEAAHVLWDKQSSDGDGLAQGTEELDAFQGAPVNGTWSLAVQGDAAEGYIDDFSIVVYYETEMPVLEVEGSPGTPGFLSLPEGAAPASPTEDEDKETSGEDSSVVPQDVPPGATIIETENFQGTWPTGDWRRSDNSNDGYQRYWDDAPCDRCGGDYAAWPADGGADRVNVCGGADYPNNMLTWMIFGPFDLSDATEAGTEFIMWREIEPNYDFAFFGVSHDGNDFQGLFWDGAAGCTRHSIGYNDWVGDPSVWVAWVFASDSSITYEGAWVDDVVIWKMLPPTSNTTVKIVPPEQTVNTNQTFTVDVAVERAQNLGAFEFALQYNNSCLRATDVTPGPFLGSTGRTVHEVGPNLTAGRVEYGAYTSGAPAGPSGNGVLATVTFQARSAACNSVVDLRTAEVLLTHPDGSAHPVGSVVDGLVRVIPPPDTCPRPNCPEDVNCDGVVNILDIQQVASKWGRSCPTQ